MTVKTDLNTHTVKFLVKVAQSDGPIQFKYLVIKCIGVKHKHLICMRTKKKKKS